MADQENPKPAIVQVPDQSFFRRRDQARKGPGIVAKLPYSHIIHSGICGSIIALFLVFLPIPAFERFEYIFWDYYFSHRKPILTDPSVVIIEIAEDGLEKIGRWPWPRQYQAVMAHLLDEWKAQSVVFDILFSETSTDFDDGALSEAIQNSQKVYLPVVLEGEKQNKKWVKCQDQFARHAKGIGHINIFPDVDGKIRRIEPYKEHDGKKYPHLALKLAADIQGVDVDEFISGLPVDEYGHFTVNWAGRWKDTFQHYSFVDLIKSFEQVKNGEKPIIDPKALAGKNCFIGLTAFGQTDIKPNPLEALYPALGVHVNVLNNTLTGEYIKGTSKLWNRGAMLLTGLLASFLFVIFRSVQSFLVGLGLGVLWLFIGYYFFIYHGTLPLVFHPLLLIVTLYIVSSAFAMILQNRERLALLFLATRDGLTGLYVIRHFRHLLNKACFESHRAKENLSVILMDVDHFKKINDTYGHQAGDMVLREIATLLQNTVKQLRPKKKDIVARYGGEEMIVYLKACGIAEASEVVAEGIRKNVETAIIHYKGVKIPVTISLGVSTLHVIENVPDLMVGRADKALYLAKHSGRNQVRTELEITQNDSADIHA